MKRYWDYDEKQRAELTEEQVRDLLDYELMEKGVLKVPPLEIEPSHPIELKKHPMFSVQTDAYTKVNVVFHCIEDANTFLSLDPMLRVDSYGSLAHFKEMKEPSIVTEDLAAESDVKSHQEMLRENQRIEARNAEARREHQSALEKIDETTAGVWGDWRNCLAAKRKREKVLSTFAEYKRLTDGNETLARTFLEKAFAPGEIVDALGEAAKPAA